MTIAAPQLSFLQEKQEILSLSGFGRPFGLRGDDREQIYITDMDQHTVFRLTSDFSQISWLNPFSLSWETPHTIHKGVCAPAKKIQGDVRLNGPHAIEFDKNNYMYITTYYTPEIIVLNDLGEYLFSIGDKKSHFPLEGPATSFLDKEERLLVAEFKAHGILAYDKAGHFLGGLGCYNDVVADRFILQHSFSASTKLGGFDRIHMVKQGPDGLLYCVDTWNHRLQRISANGQALDCLGYNPKSEKPGWQEGLTQATDRFGGFHAPVAISFDESGNFAVTDWHNNRIQIFSSTAELQYIINDLNLRRPYNAQFIHSWLIIADSHNGRVLFVPRGNISNSR